MEKGQGQVILLSNSASSSSPTKQGVEDQIKDCQPFLSYCLFFFFTGENHCPFGSPPPSPSEMHLICSLRSASVRRESFSLSVSPSLGRWGSKRPEQDVDVGFFQRSQPESSVGQGVQKSVDRRRRRHEVLQLQVEDPLQALGPLRAELCPQTQHTAERRRGLGGGGGSAAAQVVS